MRAFNPAHVVLFLALAVGVADAQLIVEDFDSQTTGSPPAWLWWNNGSSGTIMVDETTYRGSSGKSVELVRTTFDGKGFGFGRVIPPHPPRWASAILHSMTPLNAATMVVLRNGFSVGAGAKFTAGIDPALAP